MAGACGSAMEGIVGEGFQEELFPYLGFEGLIKVYL